MGKRIATSDRRHAVRREDEERHDVLERGRAQPRAVHAAGQVRGQLERRGDRPAAVVEVVVVEERRCVVRRREVGVVGAPVVEPARRRAVREPDELHVRTRAERPCAHGLPRAVADARRLELAVEELQPRRVRERRDPARTPPGGPARRDPAARGPGARGLRGGRPRAGVDGERRRRAVVGRDDAGPPRAVTPPASAGPRAPPTSRTSAPSSSSTRAKCPGRR